MEGWTGIAKDNRSVKVILIPIGPKNQLRNYNKGSALLNSEGAFLHFSDKNLDINRTLYLFI